jgi:pimeloyl-ACP methyl ester carboxylesterase
MMRILTGLIAGLCLALAGAAAAEEAAGDWLGQIKTTAELHVGVRLKKAADGGYSGTFESFDQGVRNLRLAEVTATADTLTFTVAIVGGRFEGKWDAARKAWVGEWTQRSIRTPLVLTRGEIPAMPVVAGLDGDWDGTLEVAGQRLRLAFHVNTTSEGTIATLDSIDQQANGIPVSAVKREGDKVSFEIKVIQGGFEGALDPAGQTLTGRWTQQGIPAPFVLTRRAAGARQVSLNRPQTPKPPYPYLVEDVAFDNAAARVRLAATFTRPKGESRPPVVILVSGSGPNTRNEPLMGHQVFAVIADHLTRQGIAVLRYDKRGTGTSTGDYAKATTLEFADDVDAAVAYLKTRNDIDPRHIGLIGHSEGGLIIPIVAARNPSAAFLVMMAGPGVRGLDIIIEQGRLIAKASGSDEAAVARSTEVRSRLFQLVRSDKDPVTAAPKIHALLVEAGKAQGMPAAAAEQMAEMQTAQLNTDWFRFFFDYDPAPTLRKLRIPVLALIGSNDLQVPAAQNIGPLRAALADDPQAEVRELPGLNHLFQTSRTGAPSEYGAIEETVAPAALELISSWILRQVGK